jgi:haloacetate dehalogenase
MAAGNEIAAPLLALWGDHGIPAAGADPLDVWRRWASDARGHGVACGHFLPEEAPEATQRAMVDFFTRDRREH